MIRSSWKWNRIESFQAAWSNGNLLNVLCLGLVNGQDPITSFQVARSNGNRQNVLSARLGQGADEDDRETAVLPPLQGDWWSHWFFFYQISSYLENDVIAGDSRNQPPALPLCRRPHPVFRSRIGRLQPRGDDTGREKSASWEKGRRYEMID